MAETTRDTKNNYHCVPIPERYKTAEEGTLEHELYTEFLRVAKSIGVPQKFQVFTVENGVMVDQTHLFVKEEE